MIDWEKSKTKVSVSPLGTVVTSGKIYLKTGRKKMAQKRNLKSEMVNHLFSEVEEELNEDTKQEAKKKIKALLEQKITAEKITKNLNRQIEDLRIQIGDELF